MIVFIGIALVILSFIFVAFAKEVVKLINEDSNNDKG